MCGHRSRGHGSDHLETRRHDPGMRAADADRERTADVLRHHAGEGRLEPDELEERLERAFAARTLRDLDALTGDLPRAPRRERAHRGRGWPVAPFTPLFAVVLALVAVSAAVGHPVFWLFFLLLFAHGRPWAGARPRAARQI